MTVYIILLSTILVYLIILLKKLYNHWRVKGVNGPTPLPLIGNFGNVFILKESIDAFIKRVYETHPNEKIVGLYKGISPVLLIRDPDLIKYVLITDAQNFLNRGMKTGDTGLNNNLFSLEGASWRFLRKKFAPLFTIIKLKHMMPVIQRSVNNFVNEIDTYIASSENCDIKALVSKYSTNVVISCLFGLNSDIYKGNEKVFQKIGAQIFTPSLLSRLWYHAEMIIPGIHKIFQNVDPAYKVRNFFINLVRHVAREQRGKVLMPNFIDLMLEVNRNDHAFAYKDNGLRLEITEEVIAAEAYSFFGAGQHSSSLTMSFLLHELAFHQDVQDRLRKEIYNVTEKYKGELNIDSLKEMTYLQMVLHETLRKNTTIGWLIRRSEEDYILPDINVHVQKGTTILISTSGIHCDSKYFPNPEKFDPEHFSLENRKNIPPCIFAPFGAGPRYCLGVRFAELHIMMAIAAFITRFKVEPCEKSEKRLQYDPRCIALNTISGIWLKISRPQ